METATAKPVNRKRLAWSHACIKMRTIPIHCSTRISQAYNAASCAFDAFWDSVNPPDANECIAQACIWFKRNVAEQKAEKEKGQIANAA